MGRRPGGDAGRPALSLVLVDTSIWIEVFRKTEPFDLEAHVGLEDVATCLPVVQEVLQGFRDEAAYRLAYASLLQFPILENPLTLAVVTEAANPIGWRAAKVRPSAHPATA